MTLHVCTIVTEYGLALANYSDLQMQSDTWVLEEGGRSECYNCLLIDYENKIFLLKKSTMFIFLGLLYHKKKKKKKVVLTLPLFQ